MSTLIVAAIVVISIAGICFLLISIHNKHKREAMNKIRKHFSQLATENDLNFSSQEVLKNSILGLDGVKRKIIVVRKEEELYTSLVIDLSEVKECAVKKIYGTITAGDLKSNKLEQYLEKIILHFDLIHKAPVEIIFYKNTDNHIYETGELEKKAKHWETILSKLKPALKNIA